MVAPATSTVEIAEYMSLQSAMFPGSFVGVLKNGQITNPAQTSPSASHTAHFKLKYIKHAPVSVVYKTLGCISHYIVEQTTTITTTKNKNKNKKRSMVE